MPADDRTALLRAVLESPDEDAPRLVFADWLDEHGESERAWFIRRQLEPGYVPDWLACDRQSPDQNGVRPCTREQRAHADLLPGWRLVGWNSKVGAACYSAQQDYPRVRVLIEVTFRGGFVYEVACDGDVWLTHGDELCAHSPIRRVTLTTRVSARVYAWVWESDSEARSSPRRFRAVLTRPGEGGQQVKVGQTIYFPHLTDFDTDVGYLTLLQANWPGVEFTLPPQA